MEVNGNKNGKIIHLSSIKDNGGSEERPKETVVESGETCRNNIMNISRRVIRSDDRDYQNQSLEDFYRDKVYPRLSNAEKDFVASLEIGTKFSRIKGREEYFFLIPTEDIVIKNKQNQNIDVIVPDIDWKIDPLRNEVKSLKVINEYKEKYASVQDLIPIINKLVRAGLVNLNFKSSLIDIRVPRGDMIIIAGGGSLLDISKKMPFLNSEKIDVFSFLEATDAYISIVPGDTSEECISKIYLYDYRSGGLIKSLNTLYGYDFLRFLKDIVQEIGFEEEVGFISRTILKKGSGADIRNRYQIGYSPFFYQVFSKVLSFGGYEDGIEIQNLNMKAMYQKIESLLPIKRINKGQIEQAGDTFLHALVNKLGDSVEIRLIES